MNPEPGRVVDPLDAAERIPMSKGLLLINAASSVVAKLVTLATLLWLQRFLLGRVTPEEYSVYPVLMSVMMFAPLLTSMLSGGLGRYVTEAYARGAERRVTQLVSTMFPLLLASGVLVIAVAAALAWKIEFVLTIPFGQEGDARLMLLLLALSLTMRLVSAPLELGLYVRQKFVWMNALQVGSDVFRTLLTVLMFHKLGPRMLWVVVAAVAVNLVAVVASVALSRRLVPSIRVTRNEIRSELIRSQLSFGWWAFVAQIASMIREASDPLVLNKLATPLEVTSFHVGSVVDHQLRQFVLGAALPAQPVLTALHVTGEKERLRNAYFRAGRYFLWVFLLPAVPLFMYREQLLVLYLGDRASTYSAAATVMAILLARSALLFTYPALSMIGIAKLRLRSLAVRALAIEGCNLILTVYLVGALHMGAIGSALATCLVTLVGVPLLYWPLGLELVEARLGSWLRLSAWVGAAPALAAAPLWWTLEVAGLAQDSWGLLGCISAGALLYLAILFRFCMPPGEQQELRSFARKLSCALASLRTGV